MIGSNVMSEHALAETKVAVLFTDGFEESEYTETRAALEKSGATVEVVAPERRDTRSWKGADWSKSYSVDKSLADVSPEDYDALLLPGGVINPDQLRNNPEAVGFVTKFFSSNKPIAAICHGPQMLIETNGLHGVRITSYPSLRSDLVNAGANWVDEEVVVDQGIVTSRNPNDIPAFNRKMVEEFARKAMPERKIA